VPCRAAAGRSKPREQGPSWRVHLVSPRNVAGEVTNVPAFVCSPDDDVQSALGTMSKERFHRLPVTNTDGCLVGILSLMTFYCTQKKGAGKTPEISYDEVVQALHAICSHPAGTSNVLAAINPKAVTNSVFRRESNAFVKQRLKR